MVKFTIPPEGSLGLHVDGGFKEGRATIAGIVRDHNCKWLYGYSRMYETDNTKQPHKSERMAISEGIPECVKKVKWLKNLIVYTDNEQLANTLSNSELLAAHWDCEELKKILEYKEKFKLNSLTFQHVFKQGNRAPDFMVKRAYSLSTSKMQHYKTPGDVPTEDETRKIEEAKKNSMRRKRLPKHQMKICKGQKRLTEDQMKNQN